MLRCGLRISETACLSLSDIYLTQPYPHLLVHGKGSRERNVYLSPQTEGSLKEYLAIRPAVPVDFVFMGAKNTHLSSAAIHKRLIQYREQSRVSITSHRLRHTFANDLLNAKVPITTIQKLLGHRWIETTQNYAIANDHQVREDYFAACERLDTWEDTKHINNAVKEKGGGLAQMKRLSTRASRPLSSGSSSKVKTDLLKQNHSWLITELEQFHSLRQRNWRPSRVKSNTRTFWTTHLTVWRFLCEERNIGKLSDLKRQDLLDYIASRLKTGHAASSVNNEIRNLHSFLVYLGEKGYKIPQSFSHIPSVKVTDYLPKHLTDDQMILLRTEFVDRIKMATPSQLQDALVDCSIFLLLWQCGLRSGEVEDLRLEDLDFDNCMIAIHDGKGRKDRTVYVTGMVIHALEEYLLLRSAGKDERVFLYRRAPLKRDFVYRRMKAAGARVGVKLSPHRLRHTCATQLLNAGCRETSIQKYLGHKRLNTTMIYARLYDVTLAKEYFNAVR